MLERSGAGVDPGIQALDAAILQIKSFQLALAPGIIVDIQVFASQASWR